MDLCPPCLVRKGVVKMVWLDKNFKGVLLCLSIAVPAWVFGKYFPLIGGAVTAIIVGMFVAMALKERKAFDAGVKFTSKKILQWAVVLLGFGLNLGVIIETGIQSLPIIISTIAIALISAAALCRIFNIPTKITTLVGVGSSICGGSAIAATAPVVQADDEEVAQAISVVFFFNVVAAVVFPPLGHFLGMDTTGGTAFGIFAGTAVNDTSSVTAAAATWDSMWGLGTATLDKAVTVKLTRTLAIIPITLALAFYTARAAQHSEDSKQVSVKQIFPFFIIFFVLASVITTLAVNFGVSESVFKPIKELSKFFIVMAMAAIGLNTNIVKLIKTGGKPLLLGLFCWLNITVVSLIMQHFLDLW